MFNKVTQPVKGIKSLAKQMMSGKYFTLVFVVIVCNLVCLIPGYLTEKFIKNDFLVLLIELATYVLEIYINFSMVQMFIAVFRNQQYGMDDFFSNGKFLKTALVVEIRSTIEIFLKSLLLIVPGIICAISHSQVFYVLADHPEYNSTQVLRESHKIMDGNKGKYFSLYLSFFPIAVLAQLPLRIYESVYGPSADSYIISLGDLNATTQSIREYIEALEAFENTPIALLLSMITVFVTVYFTMSKAAFYDIATGSLVVANEEVEESNYIE